MARVISFINFKGGVGKTTCTVEIAVCLARYHTKRVLLIDLDPQTNATFYLLEQPFWMEWVERQGSLKDLFEDFIAHRYTFRIDRAIVQNVAAGGLAVEGLDLLPSHLSLVTIDERLAGISGSDRGLFGPQAILKAHLAEIENIGAFLVDALKTARTTEEAIALVSAERGLSDNPAQYWLAVTTVKGFLGDLLERERIEFYVRGHVGYWRTL